MRLAERGLDEDGTLIRAERVPFMPAALLRPPSKAQYFVACNPEVVPARNTFAAGRSRPAHATRARQPPPRRQWQACVCSGGPLREAYGRAE